MSNDIQTVQPNGITVKQIAEVVGKRADNVKRDLETLASKCEDFPLHLWRATLTDSLGRSQDSYLIPEQEAMMFVATYGYRYIKQLSKMLHPSSDSKMLDVLHVNRAQAAELKELKESTLKHIATKSAMIDKINKLEEDLANKEDLINYLRFRAKELTDYADTYIAEMNANKVKHSSEYLNDYVEEELTKEVTDLVVSAKAKLAQDLPPTLELPSPNQPSLPYGPLSDDITNTPAHPNP